MSRVPLGLALLVATGCGGGEPASAPPRTGPSAGQSAGPSPTEGGEPASEATAPGLWLEEVARESGLDFVHVSGHREVWAMPEIMGGGAALLDVEGDGDLDAYLVQSGDWRGENPHGNALFLNDGAGGFTRAEGGDAEHRGYGMGVAAGDVDGDGRTDLYVTNVGPDALLAADGEGGFDDRTDEAGLGHPGWGASAAFFDADRDGDLDLYATTYLVWSPASETPCYNKMGQRDYCSPKSYEAPARDAFYRNRGDGTFADESESSGVASKPGTGLGVACADFDGDGWEDVFVANDGMADRLWRNLDGERFEDVARLAGCAVDEDGLYKAGMGVTVADVDRDLDPDLLVCNLGHESDSFFVNEGGTFRDRTARGGLGIESRPFTRFGMAWVDFDHDGLLDLFQANGRVNRQSTRFTDDPYAEPNLLLRGVAPGRFEPLPTSDGTADPMAFTSRGAAFGDVDGDGGVDVLVVNRDAPARLYVNRGERGHWVRLRLVLPTGADALGATAVLTLGDERVRGDARAAYSYQSSSDPAAHVGLGELTRVDEAEVRWPDGAVERFGPLEADRTHVLRRGAGRAD